MMDVASNKIPLKVAVFSGSEYVIDFLKQPMEDAFTKVKFLLPRLSADTAPLAKGYDAVCLFVNDVADAAAIEILASGGVKCIAMRCAGFDRVDLAAAQKLGIRVVRVPAYSPRSVAEFALTLIMASARNLRSAERKVSVGNYSLNGLVGREVSFKTYGIVGTGNIGVELIKLLRGFDGRVLAYDIFESEDAKAAGAEYVDLETLLKESDVVSLHVPLLPSTHHIINVDRLRLMKQDAMLINVSRGGLIDTNALMNMLTHGMDGLQHTGGKLSAVAMDVYENEESLFFEDFTNMSIERRMLAWDSRFAALKTLPQVIVTPHIAFLTKEALDQIAITTVDNLTAVALGRDLANEVKPKA